MTQGDNLGRPVKWQDEDGGWHTGNLVLFPGGEELTTTVEEARPTVRYIRTSLSFAPPPGPISRSFMLVRESCDGKLSWVETYLVQPWAMRSEWDKELCSV